MTEQEKIELSKRVAEKYGISACRMPYRSKKGIEHGSNWWLYKDTARTIELAIENEIDIWYEETGYGECVGARPQENGGLCEYYSDHTSKKEAVLVAVLRALEAKE